MRTGAALLVDALVAAGVRQLFSLSGNQILSVYDATIGRPLPIYHTRHEAGAVHMADAWGRLTETPGVALVTAGPGHLNAVSALYGALMSESPVVLLSGHAPKGQAGRGAFQEMDQVGAARPVTKAAWRVEEAARMGEEMERALALATAGRPGPVHLSLPGDLLDARVPDGVPPPTPPAHTPIVSPVRDAALARILADLQAARRPLIVVGPAMARSARRAAVAALSHATGIPVLPVESPRGLNDPWLHLAASVFAQADVVLLLGKRLDYTLRFGDPGVFAPDRRVIQIDWEASALAGDARTHASMVDDPARVAARLAELAAGETWKHAAWGDEVRAARDTVPAPWAALRGGTARPIHPLRVCAALQPFLDRGAILVADGGEFGQWIQAGCEAGTRLINGPSGSIGSAIPMALGAKSAHPDRLVIAALGDGTFGFHAFELDTAARHGLPILAVVGNDARWNAEHQLQLQHYGAERTVGCELAPLRYDQVAAALGAHGEHVESPGDLDAALARAVASGRPAVINVMIDGVPAPTYRAGAGAH
ncbi:MAG TPA: thiamine pyrophosphate-binding protein [Methylomirabilota bacterium]|nr:thiamine pyrophosphate-binding protein [Methylomirabilota bacterium]